MPVRCDACSGKGFKINQFTGSEDECHVCDGEGQVIPCESFFSNRPAAFRNRKCEHCHATENQHKVMSGAR